MVVRGRQPVPWEKQFSRSAALQRAERLFWKVGYEKSSMSALLKAMGIQKGSFYATFGSKHQLLVEALDRYIQWRFASFQALRARWPPLDALRRHLDGVVDESTGTDRFMGCFLVNCATELAPGDRVIREIVTKTLRAHAAFYEELFEEAKARKELPADYAVHLQATALLGVVMAMCVSARGGLPAESIRALRAQADRLVV
jgi:TetR/AcrR family transcriptional regulator, transcriptional repressor for nem operon